MDTIIHHACGHTSISTHRLGRGVARQRRIATLSSLPCLACVKRSAEHWASKLTHPGGLPYTDDERESYIERRIKLHLARLSVNIHNMR